MSSSAPPASPEARRRDPYQSLTISYAAILSSLVLFVVSQSLPMLLDRFLSDDAFYYFNTARIFARTGFSSFSSTDLARYNLFTLFAALIGFAVNQADRLFTLSQQGLSRLAVYNVAITASNVAGYAPYALVTVLLTAVVALFASGKIMELHGLIRSYTRYISLVVMPIAFGLAAVELEDDPVMIEKYLSLDRRLPMLVNIHTERLYWHAGAGTDPYEKRDRYLIEKTALGLDAECIHANTKAYVESLWKERLEKQ